MTLTRPDGAVYAGAFGLLLLCLGPRRLPARARAMAAFMGAAAATAGPYLVFRRLYFQDWMPNTYHAKVRPWLLEWEPSRVVELFESAAGRLAVLVALAILFLLGRALRRRAHPDRVALVLAVHLATAAAVYLVLPPDWMGEYRFATPFFLFLSWLTGHALAAAFEALRPVPGGWRSRCRWWRWSC
jgi:hypothetical protein